MDIVPVPLVVQIMNVERVHYDTMVSKPIVVVEHIILVLVVISIEMVVLEVNEVSVLREIKQDACKMDVRHNMRS